MRVIHDGIEAMVLPDCARCAIAEKHPHEFDECPVRSAWGMDDTDVCDPDCPYYTEDWARDCPKWLGLEE